MWKRQCNFPIRFRLFSIKRESGQVFSQPSFAIDVSDFWETFQTLNEVSPKKAEKYLKGEFSNLLGIVRKTDAIVAAKEEIILMKNIEILKAKGLMTSRGIFEHHVGKCFFELKHNNALKEDERLNTSNLILKLASPRFKIPNDAMITKAFMEAVKGCKTNLRDLYDDLSKEQHGFPWTGDSVKVFKRSLKPGHECVIDYIAKEMNLDVIKIDE